MLHWCFICSLVIMLIQKFLRPVISVMNNSIWQQSFSLSSLLFQAWTLLLVTLCAGIWLNSKGDTWPWCSEGQLFYPHFFSLV
jgi:hypothetical protein